jgi:DNA invertase Pin-like site-specific DNA recombinase
MRLLGYTCASTAGQASQLQIDSLLSISIGVQKRDMFADITFGSKTAASRPGMQRLLEYAGDTIVMASRPGGR